MTDEIKIEGTRTTARRMALRVRQGDNTIKLDEIDILKEKARDEFTEKLCTDFPGVASQRAEVMAELLNLSDRVSMEPWQDSTAKETEKDPIVVTVEPWPEPVDGAPLLNEIEQVIRRHIVVGEHVIRAASLWSLWSWVYDSFDVAPQLVLTSPVSECGKTTLLTLISELVPRALPASSISTAAVYRTIEVFRPTLLLDEADSYMAGPNASEELRGVLNSGHTRQFAFVIRCVGDDHNPRYFSTWCPRVIALIGKGSGSGLAATLEGRSIVLRMHRKKRGDISVEKRIKKDVHRHLAELARKAARWSQDHQEECRDIEPANMPDLATNRTMDNWVPLVVVADLAGGDWPKLARAAACALGGEDRSEFAGLELLADIRKWFDEHKDSDRVTTSILLEYLAGLDEQPWSTWHRGKPIESRRLARLLAPFEIKSKSIRTATGTPKGYERAAFEDAWSRYLPPPPYSIRNTATRLNNKGNSENPSATQTTFVADNKSPQPADEQQENGFVADVAGVTGGCAGKRDDPGFDDDIDRTPPGPDEQVDLFPRRSVAEKQIHVEDRTAGPKADEVEV